MAQALCCDWIRELSPNEFCDCNVELLNMARAASDCNPGTDARAQFCVREFQGLEAGQSGCIFVSDAGEEVLTKVLIYIVKHMPFRSEGEA